MKIKSFYHRLTNSFSDVDNKQNIVFLHVPKCGGTSVDTSIRDHYLTLDVRQDRRYQRIDSLKSAYIGSKTYGLNFTDGDVKNNRNMIFNRDLAFYLMLDPGVKYVSGHFPLDDIFYNEFKNEYKFITLLRDPVEKWVSNYFYRKRRSNTKNKKLAGNWIINEEMLDYVNSERGEFHGYDFSKYYGGIRDDYNYSSKDAISNAKDNLHKFSVVGILEDLENFEYVLEKETGLRVTTKHQNKSRSETLDNIPIEIISKIKEICQPDIEIYEYAKKIIYEK